MINYLAKPNETIQQHTDKLLANLQIIKNLYPNLNVNWDLLEQACLYHDLGKMNLKFQSRIEGRTKYDDEIAHNLLSLAFLDVNELRKSFDDDEILLLAHAIAYHHNRGTYTEKNYDEEVRNLKQQTKDFEYDKINITQIKPLSLNFFPSREIISSINPSMFKKFVMLKGLLNRLDYAASAGIEVEYKNDFLINGLEKLNYKWNELQEFMIGNQNKNVVVVAQTGMGKTEAGLLWIGNNKGFFTLPLKTAINEIYKRIINMIENQKCGLLHSDTYSQYIENQKDDEDITDYYNQTKQLSLPLTICTLDQLFDIVFRYRGFEPKLATLAYSKVVIDEVQMYSADLLAYLILGLSYITKFGGKFAIMTATLPGIIVDLLKKEKIEFLQTKPFINNDFIRHSIKVIDSKIDSKLIADLFNNNRILVICNTIKAAQDIYIQLRTNPTLKDVPINLIHSKFTQNDRKMKEKELTNFGQQYKIAGIWVATQVVEASLDIDFDILVTELSDVNGLFQRMGRCYRNRSFTEDTIKTLCTCTSTSGNYEYTDNLVGMMCNTTEYNCYVYTKHCSGVGRFIDEELFDMSKESISKYDGIITESDKLSMINSIYNTENLRDTMYYKNILHNIRYVKSMFDFSVDKQEVNELFRNINTIPIIPKCIFLEFEEEINSELEMIETQSAKTKRIAINRIMGYTINVYISDLKKYKLFKEIQMPYQRLLVFDNIEYSYELGMSK